MKKIKIYISLICLILGTNACGDFGDINIDPNNPAKIPADFLLTRAEKDLMDYSHNVWIGGRTTFMCAQYWSQNAYTEESRYGFRNEVTNGFFLNIYTSPLADLNEIIELNKENPNVGEAGNKTAIARILKVYLYHYMTDLWGPIPYSEALQGATNRTPKYDSQKEIYFDLIKELKESVAQMKDGEPGFTDADVIYHGDLMAWRRFANSLALRIAMRASDVEPVLAKAVIEASAAGAFTSNADNAYFHYIKGRPNSSPLNQDREDRGDSDFGISNVLIDNTLNPLNDPRVASIADKNDDGKYKGRPFGQDNGLAASEALGAYSQPAGAAAAIGQGNFKPTDMLAPDALAPLMTYSEVCFILAEARERGYNVPNTAEDWYKKGITASMNELGIDDATAIDTYLNQKDVKYTTAQGDFKQKIGVQKWIALYPQGIQGWAEWRRLDFKKLVSPISGTIGDVGTNPSPLRLTFPTEEQTKNSINYAAAVALIGADNLKTRLWWDVK